MSFHRRYALRGFFGDSGGEVLLSVEESCFGDNDADVETGIVTLGTFSAGASSMSERPFVKYTANDAISIIGLRVYPNFSKNGEVLCLYNANGELVRKIEGVTSVSRTWTMAYFDEPVNVAKGESFIVSGSSVQYMPSASLSNTVFNGKITFDGCSSSTSGGVPTSFYKFSLYGVVDIIIGKVSAELPDEYQIARTTMDDIANEVKRITGTTGKMTPKQIVTALENIAVQTTAE